MRKLYQATNTSLVWDFKALFLVNLIEDDQFIIKDINLAEYTYEPDTWSLKRKSTCRKPKHVIGELVEILNKLVVLNK